MKFKISYTVYKLRPIWPVLSFLADYFYLFIATAVLAFALYYSLSLVWGVYLFIFMLQSSFTSRKYFIHRNLEQEKFENQIGRQLHSGSIITRYTESEDQEI